jgi:hypothetical protein
VCRVPSETFDFLGLRLQSQFIASTVRCVPKRAIWFAQFHSYARPRIGRR